MKLGIWLLIGFTVVVWFKHAKRKRLRQRQNARAFFFGVSRTDVLPPERFVSCLHCGLHVPASDAVAAAGMGGVGGARFYCSDKHRQQHLRD